MVWFSCLHVWLYVATFFFKGLLVFLQVNPFLLIFTSRSQKSRKGFLSFSLSRFFHKVKYSLVCRLEKVEESCRKFGKTFPHIFFFFFSTWAFTCIYYMHGCLMFPLFFPLGCPTFHSYHTSSFPYHFISVYYDVLVVVVVVTMIIMIIVSCAKWSNNKSYRFKLHLLSVHVSKLFKLRFLLTNFTFQTCLMLWLVYLLNILFSLSFHACIFIAQSSPFLSLHNHIYTYIHNTCMHKSMYTYVYGVHWKHFKIINNQTISEEKKLLNFSLSSFSHVTHKHTYSSSTDSHKVFWREEIYIFLQNITLLKNKKQFNTSIL